MSPLEKKIVALWNGGKTVFEIHEITGTRIADIEAILRKYDGNRSKKH